MPFEAVEMDIASTWRIVPVQWIGFTFQIASDVGLEWINGQMDKLFTPIFSPSERVDFV